MTVSAEKRAYRSIINLIISGQFRPGDFLLETEIAEKLGMSRTPVGKALTMLVSEGFLNKMPKKGCYIPLPTPEDAEQVFFARKAVESQAAASAALHATEKEIQQLQEVLSKDHEALASGSKDTYSSANEEFHLGIAKASHNQYLEKWVRNIFWRSNIYVFYFDSFYKGKEFSVPQKTPMQHATIIRAIADRDPKKAAQLMDEHIQWTYENLLMKY
jgi:DNA-binding GntR family transcriptional regulator